MKKIIFIAFLTWQTLASYAQFSGGSQSVGTTSDNLKVKRITTSQVLALNTDVLFNSIPTGSIPYNAATGLATLTANKQYRINARLVGRNDGTGTTQRYITYEILNSANANLPITANATTGTEFLATSINNEGGGSEATADFTPTANTDIKIRITGIDGSNWTLDQDRSYLEITQISTSATTSTTRVNVICRNKTTQSITSATWVVLNNWTVVQDPTGSMNGATGLFTAPRNMTVTFTAGNSVTTSALGQYYGICIYKNSVTQFYNNLQTCATGSNLFPCTSGVIELLAGETIQVRSYSGGTTANDTPSVSNSWFTITEQNPTF
jgi:hypothetical protein